MQLPRRLFAPVLRSGTILGEALPELPYLAGIPVITAADHDTAANFAAGTGGPDQLVISLDTWSLVGVELTSPLITDAGRGANFTNEVGVLGTIRFLRNAMGLWLTQELLREWQSCGRIPQLGNNGRSCRRISRVRLALRSRSTRFYGAGTDGRRDCRCR